MPYLLGLTGNIACGKSTVGRLLASRYGVEYVDADALVHQLYEPGRPEWRAILDRFGREYQRADGTIDRSMLGPVVLSDPRALADLEAILYPGVGRLIEERVRSTAAQVVVLDAIKLIESGLADHCDAIWVVTCSRADQIRRLKATRNFSDEEAALRVDAQGSQEEKLRRATAVIDNDGSLEKLARQIDVAWKRTVQPHLPDARRPRAGRIRRRARAPLRARPSARGPA